jgi:hypothetical protein
VLGHYEAGNIVEDLLSGRMRPQLIVPGTDSLLRSSGGWAAFGDGEFLQAGLGTFCVVLCGVLVHLRSRFVGRRLGEKA